MLLFTLYGYSQDSNLHIELNFPVPVDKNFVGENYNGTIDFGAGYRFFEFKKVKIGLSLNTGFYRDNDNTDTGFDRREVTFVAYQPRIFGEFFLEEDGKFRPRLGLGYTSLRFKITDLPSNFIGEIEDTDTRGGFNLNVGVSFYFTPKLFGLLQYDFVRLGNESTVVDETFSNNVNLLKIGVGYLF